MLLNEEITWILLNMYNALSMRNMLSFEIFTRKLVKEENPFQKNTEQYKIFEETKKLYNDELRDMLKVCKSARGLVEDICYIC